MSNSLMHAIEQSRPDSVAEAENLLENLARARKTGSKAAIQAAEQQLVLHFRSFAVACANRFRGRNVDLDDLIQIAEVGLVKAARGWRPQPAGGFLQYAKPMVVGELKRYFRDQAPMIRLPRHLQETGAAVAMARRDLSRLGRRPTDAEVADAAGVTVAEVRADSAARSVSDVESLEIFRCDSSCPKDSIVSPAEAVEIRIMLREAIGTLLPRQRDLLAMRFFNDLSQEEIGAILGVSQMQVSRLLRAALDKLQHRMAAA